MHRDKDGELVSLCVNTNLSHERLDAILIHYYLSIFICALEAIEEGLRLLLVVIGARCGSTTAPSAATKAQTGAKVMIYCLVYIPIHVCN